MVGPRTQEIFERNQKRAKLLKVIGACIIASLAFWQFLVERPIPTSFLGWLLLVAFMAYSVVAIFIWWRVISHAFQHSFLHGFLGFLVLPYLALFGIITMPRWQKLYPIALLLIFVGGRLMKGISI